MQSEGSYIKEERGDLLSNSARIRCHQVNCRGVMGAGLAKQVKEKYPEVFAQYKALCDFYGSALLGHTQFIICHDNTIVANMFAQDDCGTDKVQTDMGALDDCLAQVSAFCFRVGEKPAFPKLLGCGLAGGDWNQVYELIRQNFDFKGAGCTIVEYASEPEAEKPATAKPTQKRASKGSETAAAKTEKVNTNMQEVIIYTDGSCRFNPGPGGWGAILIAQGKKGPVEKRMSGCKAETTNNEMELTAVKEALSALKQPCRVTLYSDSSYVVNSISKGWLAGWEKKGWVKKGGIANLELWKEVYQLLQKHKVTCVWVKGHADNPYNNLCDEMAQAESSKLVHA